MRRIGQEGRTAISENKIFVGNLNFATTEQELRRTMSEVGRVVDIQIPTDRDSGRPRGFAFVKFGSAEEAEAAIERFDGEDLAGRSLRVSPARERGERSKRQQRSRSFDGSSSSPSDDDGEDFADSSGFEGEDELDWRSERSRPRGKGSRKGARGKKRSL